MIKRVCSGFGILVLIGLVVFCLTPILVMMLLSLQKGLPTQDNLSTLFLNPTLSNYQLIFQQSGQWKYVVNSLYVACISTILSVFLGAMVSYACVKWNFFGKKLLTLSSLYLRVIPTAVMAIPVYVIWTFQFGISNSLHSLIFVYTALNLPFVMWILQGFFQQVPSQIHEIGRVDGANEWQIFWHLIVPIIRPGLAAASIFTFRIVWNEFLLAMILTNRDTRTVPVHISLFSGAYGVEWGHLMALGFLISVIPIGITIFASQYIISGMTAGSVKS